MAKVSTLDDKRPKCCYCGLAPADDHPDYTCPRIGTISVTDEGVDVSFWEPVEWQEIAKKLGLIK